MYRSMIEKSTNKSIVLGTVIVLIIAFMALSACNAFSALIDISDISSSISEYYVVYKSERGFGNDRFDIYSFSLEQPDDLDGFIEIDREFDKYSRNFITMIESIFADDHTESEAFKMEIKRIAEAKDGRYMHLSSNGSEKLYMYSPKLNQGYCFILVI